MLKNDTPVYEYESGTWGPKEVDNGVSPSAENVQSGKYPLAVPLGIVWKGELKGLAKEFVEYLFSAEGKKAIASHGDIPAL